ncbi:MAG: NAD-glutamate dehydrogenase [Acidimicrobiia bacterium]|nr:NAD-glutamate dehydrogenase [Acidimicrobiia bacterium]
MSNPDTITPDESPLVGATIEQLGEICAPDSLDVVCEFARLYLRRVQDGPLSKLKADQLAAHVAGLFRFASDRGLNPVAVRAFNPTLGNDGYATHGTVVEVSTGDRPFLIDSVTGEIQSHGPAVEHVVHPVLGTERDDDGALTAVGPARGAKNLESIQHYQLDRVLAPHELENLHEAVVRTLGDVRRAVDDFEPLKAQIGRMIELADAAATRYSDRDIDTAKVFLEWLLDLNFVFLGFREYEIVDLGGEPHLQVVPDSGLGILRGKASSAYAEPVPMAELPGDLRSRFETGELLVITKANSVSTVHRRVKLDYIGLRVVDADGNIRGEARVLGIFTSKAYMAAASQVPVLDDKLQQIIEAEDLIEGSHDHKVTVEIFESFPKEELFSSPVSEIHASVVGLMRLRESQHVKLFVRRDLLNRSVAIVVALPRDRFNAPLRKRLQALFMDRFNGTSVDYLLALGEVDPAQIHFTVWVREGEIPEVSFEDLEQEVAAMTRTWEDRLTEELIGRVGEEEGKRMASQWAGSFPEYYQTSVELGIAAGDVINIDRQNQIGDDLMIGLQNETGNGEGENLTRLTVYCRHDKLPLSAIMPHLEALGLHVIEEIPTRLLGDYDNIFIHDFGVLSADGRQLDIEADRTRITAAVDAVFEGRAESDSLNRLIVTAGLDHHQISVLRAYRTYMRRVATTFTANYINDTLASHPKLSRKLYRLFEARFDPAADPDEEAEIRSDILESLDRVASLDEDRILRGLVGVIDATMRTNVYQPERNSVALKLRSAAVPGMPKPFPLYEIFVHAPEVEGIHLRGGMVARGGIRWSTRREDYRTEVLGLMKAQMTKNAVIVPTGSKGGFVLRRPPEQITDMRDEVRRRYITFIEGLLDLTDNLVEGKVIHPLNTRIHDGEDPYLVVAADKGTAALSDTANEVAADYGFWLGDAFASGGAQGYDHKALGITARGGWESVKQLFRDVGHDTQTEPFNVVGIGDMSGDVFGNGMLLSEQIRLIAAFDHRDIFVDPNPDPAVSYAERRRLFETAGSSWRDYNPELLTSGGAVFSRSAKEITLSPEARAALHIDGATMTPAELINSILKAPVDLLWNGGIGTYVKASTEAHSDAGDRSNDSIRVDGLDLRCKVVGEGGNLGFTQLGRIEYAKNGGSVHTDFIDNSGGVHCSDREVNLKILLGLAEERGELDRETRDDLVTAVADDVTGAIIYDNFLQAQILSQEAARSATLMETYEQGIQLLESQGLLERAIEFLPSSEDIAERIKSGEGMTKPELAVLLAYGKRSLYGALLDSSLIDHPYFAQDLTDYFPAPVVARFGHLIGDHPLRRELIATIVANQVMNSEGITFMIRLMDQTAADAPLVVKAYRVARAITGAGARWDELEAAVGTIEPDVLRELMDNVDWLVETTARWFLNNPAGQQQIDETIEQFAADYESLTESIGSTGAAAWQQSRKEAAATLRSRGVPDAIARHHAYIEDLVHAPDIIELAQQTGRSVAEVSGVFFRLGKAVRIDWLEEAATALDPANRWTRLAKQAAAADLVVLRRRLAERVLAKAGSRSPRDAVRKYLEERSEAHGRLLMFMRQLAEEGVDTVDAVIVATRQIERNMS